MRIFFALVLGLLAFSPLTAQNRGANSGSQSLGADVSGSLSQMETSLAKTEDDVFPVDAYFLGRAVAANIVSRYRPYTRKPEATRYLNEICATLTINSPMPDIYNGYHVMILDSLELNAFATAGGHIFITRGLLETLQTEDALAAVIAHEIAHIQLNHSVDLIKYMRLTQELSGVADRSAGIAAREASLSERKTLFDNAVREMVTTLIVNGYSQEQEFQADIYAVKLLALAGYAPASLVDVLALLQKTAGTAGFNGTHPSPAQRVAHVRQEMTKNGRFYQIQDTHAFRVSRFEGTLK
ncbi:MAG: M48 family metalloprotease [Treponema sp.]|jgi:predicted Zn-dependent protease|nr:M48 family metalloprotease [Treponema sp.]